MKQKLTIGISMLFFLVLLSSFASASLSNGVTSYWNFSNTNLDFIGSNDLNPINSYYGVGNLYPNALGLNAGYTVDTSTTGLAQGTAQQTFSYNTWIFISGNSTIARGLAGQKLTGINNYAWYLLLTPENKLNINLYDGSNNPAAVGATILNNSQWYMITFIRSPTYFAVYINGILETNISSSITPNYQQYLILGARPHTLSERFSGLIGQSIYFNNTILNESAMSILLGDGNGTKYPFTPPTPNATAGDITAYDTKNSDFLFNFTVTLPNGTIITTTNGTASYDWNLTYLHNFTVSATGFYTESYTNINMSDAFQSNLTMFTGIGARDIYTNTTIPLTRYNSVVSGSSISFGSSYQNFGYMLTGMLQIIGNEYGTSGNYTIPQACLTEELQLRKEATMIFQTNIFCYNYETESDTLIHSQSFYDSINLIYEPVVIIEASKPFLLGSQIENGDVNKVYFETKLALEDEYTFDTTGEGFNYLTVGSAWVENCEYFDSSCVVRPGPLSLISTAILQDFNNKSYYGRVLFDISASYPREMDTAGIYLAENSFTNLFPIITNIGTVGTRVGPVTLRDVEFEINTTGRLAWKYSSSSGDSSFYEVPNLGGEYIALDNVRYYSYVPIQFNITQEGYYAYTNESYFIEGEPDFTADLQQFRYISARNIYTNETISLNTSVVSSNNGVLYNGADILNGNTSRVYINTGSSFTDITINIPLHDIVTYTHDIRQTGTDLLADVRPFTVLKINGTQLTTNTGITTFNTTIRNSTGSIVGTYSTTNGSIFVELTQGLYNVSFDSSAHEFQTKIVNVSGQTTNTSFSVFTTNSVQITYRDAVTNNLIVGNITVEFVSDLVAYNFTTSNASLYVDLLSPASYILRSTVASYDQNTYFFILANRTYNNLTVYLTNSTDTTEVTIKVVDSVDNQPLQDYIVKVLKFSPGSNTYIVNEILQTNFEGEVVGDILLGSEFYRFIIENLQGEVVESTDPAYIYKTSLTISVNIAGAILEDYTSLQGLSGSLIYNPDTESFRYTYSDSSNTLSQVCVRVQLLQGITVTDYSETCASTSSGVIVSPINATNGTTYIASAYANFENGEIFLTSLTQAFSSDIVDDSNWLFYAAIITMGLMLLTLWNPMIMVMVIPLPTLIFTIAGFIPLPLSVVVGMTMVFWVVAGYLGAKFK